MRLSGLALTLIALAAPGGLPAQTTEREARCAFALRELPDVRGEDWVQALHDLRGCGDTAIAVIVRLWEQPPTGRHELGVLSRVSSEMSDRRVFAAERRAAMNGSLPRVTRLEAIAALIIFADPELLVLPNAMEAGFGTSPRPAIGSLRDPGPRSREEIELSRSLRPEVMSTLAELAASDGSEAIRFAAGELRKQLELSRWLSKM